jgi:hypothetical protein
LVFSATRASVIEIVPNDRNVGSDDGRREWTPAPVFNLVDSISYQLVRFAHPGEVLLHFVNLCQNLVQRVASIGRLWFGG